MKRLGLLLFLTAAACHRDRDLRICEYNPGYCADADTDADVLTADGESEASTDSIVADSEPDAIGPDSAIDSVVADGDSDSPPSDAGSDADAAADSTTVDSAPEAAIDSAPIDSGPPDTCTCTPGEVVSVTGTCPGALEKKTKTCSSSCTWGAEVCAIPKGWTKIADPPTGFDGRVNAAATWTGGELFLHGGTPTLEGSAPFANGALYQLITNSWTLLPTTGAPSARSGHACVFTGVVVLCWGGQNGGSLFADGAEYTPLSAKWTALPAAPLGARSAHVGVWSTTTKELLIWGGSGSSSAFADGAAYNPTTNAWTPLPAAPISARRAPFGAWTGSELLVWGGSAWDGTRLTDGALYDPAKKTWRAIPAATLPAGIGANVGLSGGRLNYFGGLDSGGTIRWGGETTALDTFAWSSVPTPDAATFKARFLPSSWSVGDRWFLWSGYEDDGSGGVSFLTTGAAYDVKTKVWSTMDSTNAPTGRAFAVSLGIGIGGIVWGGNGKPGGGIMQPLRDGAVFVP